MRRAVAFLLLLVAWLWPARAIAAEEGAREYPKLEGLGAKAYCLIERKSGRILYADNQDAMLPMASTTKIMTALLALENSKMDEIVTTSKNASGVTGTSMYLQVGEKLPMRQMLEGLMLRSGNDAAVAIAEHISGTVQDFAKKMNARAEELGIDAHFVTPNGLDAQGHGASALAMAKLAAKALENGDFREIVGTTKATVPWEGNEYDRVLTNKNRLLKEYEGATGVKTGYTSKAGRCLVFSAERDGMELVGCVLNCYTWFDSAEKLLDAGFENYSAQAANLPENVRVSGGREGTVRLAADSLQAPLMQHEAWELVTEIPSSLRAPVDEGQQVGRAYIILKETGEILCETPIYAAQSVRENSIFAALQDIFANWPVLG